jgi:glycosyltransferase involved in cell wall biosynthesis
VKIMHVDTGGAWRGGQNQVLLAAQGMAALGHQVTLACATAGALAQRARAAGLAVAEFHFEGDLSAMALVGVRRAVRQRLPDVVQVHDSHGLLPALFALGAEARRRLVATRRVDFPLRHSVSALKYRAAGRIIAVSRCVASVLAGGGIPAAIIRVVHDGVADRPPAPGGRDALAELGVPADALVVGNAAALTDHKDHLTLLRAARIVAREIGGAYFVIAGEGEQRDQLIDAARELGVQDRCVFAGQRGDLDRLIPAFDVFCLSSHMEGLGSSLLDAMAFGRPIAATAAGGVPEAVLDGVNGRLVPIRDHEKLAQALCELLRDDELRRRLGAEGRRVFERRFSAERMVAETLRVYDELN